MKYWAIFNGLLFGLISLTTAYAGPLTHVYTATGWDTSSHPSIKYEIRWKWWTIYGEPVTEAVIKWDIDEHAYVTIPGESGLESIRLSELPAEAKRKINLHNVKVKVRGSYGGPTFYHLIDDAGSLYPPGSGKFSFNSPGSKKWDRLLLIELMGEKETYADASSAKNIYKKGLKDPKITLESYNLDLSDLHYWWRQRFPARDYADLRNHVRQQIEVVHKSLGFDKGPMESKLTEIDKQAKGGSSGAYNYKKADLSGAIKRLRTMSERLDNLPKKFTQNGNEEAYEKLKSTKDALYEQKQKKADNEKLALKQKKEANTTATKANSKAIADKAKTITLLEKKQQDRLASVRAEQEKKLAKERAEQAATQAKENERRRRINKVLLDIDIPSADDILMDCGRPNHIMPASVDAEARKSARRRLDRWKSCIKRHRESLKADKAALNELIKQEEPDDSQLRSINRYLSQITESREGLNTAVRDLNGYVERWNDRKRNVIARKNEEILREQQAIRDQWDAAGRTIMLQQYYNEAYDELGGSPQPAAPSSGYSDNTRKVPEENSSRNEPEPDNCPKYYTARGKGGKCIHITVK